MKTTILLTALVLSTNTYASGCMGAFAGWETEPASVKLISSDLIIFKTDDLASVDCQYGSIDIRFKNDPRVFGAITWYSNQCENFKKVLAANEGATLELRKENVDFVAYDDCNWPMGEARASGRYSLTLKSEAATLNFHYPKAVIGEQELKTLPLF